MRQLALSIVLVLVAQDAAPVVPDYPAPAEVRAAFLKLLDRPKVPLDPRPIEVQGGAPGEESVIITTEATAEGLSISSVPVRIVKPKGLKGRAPVVIVLHGTGGSGWGVGDWLKDLAARGIIGVSIDARFHGSRAGTSKAPLHAYNEAIIGAWRADAGARPAYPLYFDTCWDVWRTIDYLQTRDDIDPRRIGLMGISKGGIETWLAGAVDERVKVAAPCISVQSFRWSLDNDKWQGRANTIAAPHKVAAQDRGEAEVTRETCRALWSKVIPGMLDQFDCPSMLRLYAGRPLLIINGDEDPNCPLGGVKVAVASAEKAYRDANAPEKLKVDVARKSGHTVTPAQRAMVLAWFEKWL